jgi:DNA-binding phage protein
VKDWQKIIKYLEEEAHRQNISQVTLAKRTGISQPNISRFFKAEVCPRLDTFLSITNALGINLSPERLEVLKYLK